MALLIRWLIKTLLFWIVMYYRALIAQEPLRKHIGLYENASYGFRVTIPKPYVCVGSAPPAPAHGCTVVLEQQTQSTLDVYAQYDVLHDLTFPIWLLGIRDKYEYTVVSQAPIAKARFEGTRGLVLYKVPNGSKRRRDIATMLALIGRLSV